MPTVTPVVLRLYKARNVIIYILNDTTTSANP